MEPGRIVDRYELVRLLGRGGQGEVWEAVLRGAMGFRRAVALKLFRGEAHAELLREARLGALVSHPNLGATFDCGTADGLTWVSMALLQGPTLGQLLASGPLPPAMVIDAGLQVAAALAHVHALPLDDGPVTLLHLDVKPSNLVLDAGGQLRLVDLGVAALAGATRTGGTRGYCPPEQLAGAPEARSDLYALGVTLAALALARRPWAGLDPLDFTRRIEALGPALADEVDARVPGLGAVLRRTVRARPADRYPDAEALAEALAGVRRRAKGPAPAWGSYVPVAPVLAPFEPDSVSDEPLVGRESLLADLDRRLAAGRVVTLVAPGGMGKTRVARAVLERAPEGKRVALFVDLVGAERAADAVQAVALALGTPAVADDVARSLGSHPPLLLVLDNAEQVEGVGPLVEAWATGTRSVAFLVTSRAPLGVVGEVVVPVPPLSPEAALALYRLRNPDDPAPDLGALDGIPLAVELAALGAGTAGVAARHRSLDDVLASTVAALGPAEREALADLAVFAGSFSLEAACAVLRRSVVPAVARVDALLAAGLVQPDGERLRVLVPVREFVTARAAPADRLRAELRHGAWFAQVPAVATMVGRQSVADLDEVRAAYGRAWARCVAGGGEADRRVAATAAVALGRHLYAHGALAEARALAERAFAVGSGLVRAVAGLLVGDLSSDEYTDRAGIDPWVAPALASGVPELVLRARFQLLAAASRGGDDERLAEGLTALVRGWDEVGRPREAIRAAAFGAGLLRARGRVAEALALLQLRPLDDPSLDDEDRALFAVPIVDVKLGGGDRSVVEVARWVASRGDALPQRLAARVLEAATNVELDSGDPARAEGLATRALAAYERMGGRVGAWFCRAHLVRAHVVTGRLELALAEVPLLLAEPVPLQVSLPTRLNAAEACEFAGDLPGALRWLDEAQAEARSPVERAILDGARGARLAAGGDADQGLRLLDDAARTAESLRFPRLASMARVTQLVVVWDLGRWADAEALLRVATASWQALPLDMELELRRVVVERSLREGRRAEAQAAFDALVAAAGERARYPRTRAWRALQQARDALGRTG